MVKRSVTQANENAFQDVERPLQIPKVGELVCPTHPNEDLYQGRHSRLNNDAKWCPSDLWMYIS